MNEKDNNQIESADTADVLWGMFEKTGQLGYYLLHSEIVRDDES